MVQFQTMMLMASFNSKSIPMANWTDMKNILIYTSRCENLSWNDMDFREQTLFSFTYIYVYCLLMIVSFKLKRYWAIMLLYSLTLCFITLPSVNPITISKRIRRDSFQWRVEAAQEGRTQDDLAGKLHDSVTIHSPKDQL